MAGQYKSLGQSLPAANTPTVIYTCPASSTITSTLIICNTSTTTVDYVQVWHAVGGASFNAKQYLTPPIPVYPGQRLAITEGWCMQNTDTINVESQLANLTSFNLYGAENQ